MGKPRIAITTCAHDARRCVVARGQYLAAIERAGGDPIAIATGDPPPETFDGLCLTGGEDIDPARYGEEIAGSTGIDGARDALELALLDEALARDVPVLAICRGHQLLNVRFRGSLEQHRAGHSPKYSLSGPVADDPLGPDAVHHTVRPGAGSRLALACGGGPFRVNSSHHQVVTRERLGDGLVATASVDDVVEAVESVAHRWVVGVQWHPERTAQVAPEATRVFDAFVAAAGAGEPVRTI